MTTTIGKTITLHEGDDRAEWLDARRGIYTATQVSAIAGSNPYYKLIDVWNEHTDPDWSEDDARNRWLAMRAELGQEREQEIIAWASEDDRTGGPANPFLPNRALVAKADEPTHAVTPDGYKTARNDALVLIECKTTSQRWDDKGIPQHILDQVEWQYHVTGAVTVWLAVEFYAWSKGRNPVATLVGTMLVVVPRNPRRLEFLLERVAWFDQLKADGIAPESDLRLDAEPEFDPFDDEDEARALAEHEEAQALDAKLTELAEIIERTKPDLDRADVLKAEIKTAAKVYEGRRVHLIGQRMVAKLTRSHVTKTDLKAIDPAVLQAVTSWAEQDRLVIEANPEYAPTSNESETTE
jgi:hypothetical protein